jgi:hypothetical protein
MKICLNCQKEYQNKREASKYCSDKCRVAYNRKHPQNSVSKTQVQVLYNEMLEMVAIMKESGLEIRVINPIPAETAIAIHNTENKDQLTSTTNYDYNGLKQLISASTSAYELEQAWRIVKAAAWLAGWQLKELTRLKDLQQTKIDF